MYLSNKVIIVAQVLFVFHNFVVLASNQDSIKNKQLRIALIGVHDEGYDAIGKYAHLNKQAYAKKHGYDVYTYTENLDKNRKPYWSKIIALRKHLADYDWLFWLDSDALIMNDSIKLEAMIDDTFDFITTRDCLKGMNSGQFLIKNCEWSHAFLKLWYDPKYENSQIQPGYDNGALIEIYETFPQLKERIKIIPQRLLSSYLICPVWYNIDGQYKEGDFVVHFAAVESKLKKQYMEEYYLKIQTN